MTIAIVFIISFYLIVLFIFLAILVVSSTSSRFTTARSSILNIDARAIDKV